MATQAGDEYLRSAVMTASPPQLQLMLYDGAIRFGSQARDALLAKQIEKSYELLSRVQKIVLEMDKGLRPELNPELCDRMSRLYTFIYRKLVEADVRKDVSALDDALKILRHIRETWVMLIDKLSESSEAGAAAAEGGWQEGQSISVEG